MLFGFDIDGVLYPWHYIVWKWTTTKDGYITTTFDEFWNYPDGWVAQNEGTDLVKAMVAEESNYMAVPLSAYVKETVHRIASQFADDVFYITGRPLSVKDATQKYLVDNGLPSSRNLYFSKENGGKLNIIKELGCNYYVEDQPKHLEVLPKVATIFAVVAPYNTHKKWDAISIHHIMEIPYILEGIHGF